MFKNLILLSGFSAFVVFAIIALSIYHTRTTSTLTPITQAYSTPIEPSFDEKTLRELKNRNTVTVDLKGKSGVITQGEIDATQGGTLSIPSATPTQTVRTTPTPASPSATQTP